MREPALRSWTASPARARAERSSLALRWACRIGCAVLMLLAPTAVPRNALGAESDRQPAILLTVAAEPAEAEQMAAVARELLGRLAMQVVLRQVERVDLRELRQPPMREPAYFARVWIGLGKTGRARLYLEQAARDRVLVRDVANDAHNAELVREELGHILQTALEGLKAGEEIGAPRGEALEQVDAVVAAASPSSPTAELRGRGSEVGGQSAVGLRGEKGAEAPRTSRRSRWHFGPRYELVWLGDGGRFEDGPGAVLGALLPGSQRFGLEVGGFFRRPMKVEANPVGARLQSLTFAALVTFDAWQGERARFRLGAGVEADFVRVSPFVSAERDVKLARSRWLKLALGRLALTYAHDVGNFMAVEVTLGAELDVNGTRYIVQRDAGAANVLAPWPIRPLLSLGAAVP